ncbi:hypothetical protein Tco_1378727 [Tanacetum coccineum]
MDAPFGGHSTNKCVYHRLIDQKPVNSVKGVPWVGVSGVSGVSLSVVSSSDDKNGEVAGNGGIWSDDGFLSMDRLESVQCGVVVGAVVRGCDGGLCGSGGGGGLCGLICGGGAAKIAKIPYIRHLRAEKERHNEALKVLKYICKEVREIDDDNVIREHYTEALLIALDYDNSEAIEEIIRSFPQAIWTKGT